ncbi:hypothetical protein ODJ79_37395 [Actinoplanes sp. KI2]|uniref:hypothetical protein n=1 Tax=Actinoplanes sp. KI2 TaxID=2983315 RepID=UPI0021D607EA|nr:hypothetical protein [Actinoplanes sp. KI2]MCU7729424.1 hypothetical protein [Actinoplanes sp. KI2]
MAAADVAGTIRARALARRRVGVATARRLAGIADFRAAVSELACTPYGREVRPGQSPAQAEHAVGRCLVWHLRVLAGWQSRHTAEMLRVLAGGYELDNLDERRQQLAGRPAEPLFRLGALASAGARLEAAATRPALRASLAASVWGDPGADSEWALSVVPRLSWLHRVALRVPAAADWAAGAALLLLARHRVLEDRPVDRVAAAHLLPLTGAACLPARTLTELAESADRRAGWVLTGVRVPGDLWRAEVRWWLRLDRDGVALLHGARFTGDAAVGCAAVLAVDAWRVRAALESAARGGNLTEVFDATY